YRIEPGDRRLQALVGVDERAGPLGSVVFRVLVDNKPRYQSPPLTDRDAPKPIDLDLAGGKFLILATEFGDRGDVRDLADWVEARVIGCRRVRRAARAVAAKRSVASLGNGFTLTWGFAATPAHGGMPSTRVPASSVQNGRVAAGSLGFPRSVQPPAGP